MPNTLLSAREIYDIAPLGSLIRFSDGAPEPPARHRRKRTAWLSNNGAARLVRKTPADHLSGAPIVGGDVPQDVLQLLGVEAAGGEEPLRRLRVAQDRRERLIDLVGQSAGELAEHRDPAEVRQLLALLVRLALGPPLLGDVADESDHAALAAQLDDLRGEQDVPDLSRLRAHVDGEIAQRLLRRLAHDGETIAVVDVQLEVGRRPSDGRGAPAREEGLPAVVDVDDLTVAVLVVEMKMQLFLQWFVDRLVDPLQLVLEEWGGFIEFIGING